MATVKGTKQSKDALGAKGKKDQFQFDPNDLVLVVDPKHPLYDKRVHLPVKESLVRNIMAFGVIEPIVVRKNPETGEVEVVAGRQRVMACREANRRLIAQGLEPHWIPAIVRRGECTSLMGVMASENEHREDDSPVGRAEKMQRMLDMGRSEEEVAVTFGLKTAATVKQSVLLLEAPRVVRDAVESEAITPTEGSKLAKMEPEAATKALERLLKEAPRQSGKKRRANAKRAREMIAPDPPGTRQEGAAGDVRPAGARHLRAARPARCGCRCSRGEERARLGARPHRRGRALPAAEDQARRCRTRSEGWLRDTQELP